MALALITVGTSYREALCWDFGEEGEEAFEDPLFDRPAVSPLDPEVRRMRQKMGQKTRDIMELETFSESFRIIKTPEQTWRYPAEIDTLIHFSNNYGKDFNSINRIKHILPEDNEEAELGSRIICEILKCLWKHKFEMDEAIYYPHLDTKQIGVNLIKDIQQNLGDNKPVYLFVTGGYKIAVMMAGTAFHSMTTQENRLIYKHEDSGLIYHKGSFEHTEYTPLIWEYGGGP